MAVSKEFKQPPFWENDPPAPGIFLNYRYIDIMAAVALDEMLIPRYGEHAVFRADRSLKPGDPYKTVLTQASTRASLMLALIGHNWAQSLAEGKHEWALLELQQAESYRVPILPVCLSWTRNDHTAEMLWCPVEVPTEELSEDSLPECIPRSLLDCKATYFGTQQPWEDAANIAQIIGTIVPALAEPAQPKVQ